MLRLACGGLNLDDDTQIFIRNSTIETLLSFYSSPLSDKESKEIILEVKFGFFGLACFAVDAFLLSFLLADDSFFLICFADSEEGG